MTDLFHGSYLPEDVSFLLKPVSMPFVSVTEKENLIQSGAKHYSEMLSPERLPSPAYYALFHDALERNTMRFASDVTRLAQSVALAVSGPITLVSLARAGTPVGVLLRRLLAERHGRDVRHYSISIIRDRGIDNNALRWILEHERRPQEGIVFVDGWTGKGVIQRELYTAVTRFNVQHGTALSPNLYVVADLCGVAGTAATTEDYLIPSSILNATVSGLVSRSVLNSDYVGPGDFHACVYYREFEAQDISRWFIDTIMEAVALLPSRETDAVPQCEDSALLRERSKCFLRIAMERYSVHTENYVKPGIGEATRVLLRRAPHLVLLRNTADPDVRHLLALAEEKSVPVEVRDDLPYKAVALIKHLVR